MDFIEHWFGVSPDQGDGSLEVLWVAAIVVAGLALGLRRRLMAWLSSHAGNRRSSNRRAPVVRARPLRRRGRAIAADRVCVDRALWITPQRRGYPVACRPPRRGKQQCDQPQGEPFRHRAVADDGAVPGPPSCSVCWITAAPTAPAGQIALKR
jgi:hypothetical protein